MVHWFEKTDDRDQYRRAKLIKVPADQNSADPSRSERQMIINMTVSPSEETLVVSTDSNQIYYTSLSSTEMGKVSWLTFTTKVPLQQDVKSKLALEIEIDSISLLQMNVEIE